MKHFQGQFQEIREFFFAKTLLSLHMNAVKTFFIKKLKWMPERKENNCMKYLYLKCTKCFHTNLCKTFLYSWGILTALFMFILTFVLFYSNNFTALAKQKFVSMKWNVLELYMMHFFRILLVENFLCIEFDEIWNIFSILFEHFDILIWIWKIINR